MGKINHTQASSIGAKNWAKADWKAKEVNHMMANGRRIKSMATATLSIKTATNIGADGKPIKSTGMGKRLWPMGILTQECGPITTKMVKAYSRGKAEPSTSANGAGTKNLE